MPAAPLTPQAAVPPQPRPAVVGVARHVLRDLSRDDAASHAAAIAFYLVLSLAPTLLVALAIAGAFAGRDRAQHELLRQFAGLVGEDGRALAQTLLARASEPSSGVWATAMGLVVLIVGASGAFAQLKQVLNKVWDVRALPRERRWHGFIMDLVVDRLLSFAMVVVIAFLLLASLVISALLAGVGAWASATLPAHEVVLQILNLGVALLVITVLFLFMFKALPDAHVGWREAWIGAIVTSVLFNAGKTLIGLYIGRSGVASPFGAASSVIVVLVWLYYSALIVILGAEITQATAHRLGKAIKPAKGFETSTE